MVKGQDGCEKEENCKDYRCGKRRVIAIVLEFCAFRHLEEKSRDSGLKELCDEENESRVFRNWRRNCYRDWVVDFMQYSEGAEGAEASPPYMEQDIAIISEWAVQSLLMIETNVKISGLTIVQPCGPRNLQAHSGHPTYSTLSIAHNIIGWNQCAKSGYCGSTRKVIGLRRRVFRNHHTGILGVETHKIGFKIRETSDLTPHWTTLRYQVRSDVFVFDSTRIRCLWLVYILLFQYDCGVCALLRRQLATSTNSTP